MTDELKHEIEYPNLDLPQQPRAREIFGMFQTVSAVPTDEPKNWFDQIQYYKSGATLRIYIYDATNQVWSYAALI